MSSCATRSRQLNGRALGGSKNTSHNRADQRRSNGQTSVFRTTMGKRSLQPAQQRVQPTLLAQPSTWARLFGVVLCR
jgi:hypothetical protein